MKKIFLLLTIFSLVFTSCEPLEDINNAVDAKDTPIVGDVTFTLTDEDYTDKLGLNFPNFGSEADAKTKIPVLLDTKYPAWGKNSSATVTFKIYNKKNDEKSLIVYTAKTQDYTDAGLRFTTISSQSQMDQLLNHLYPSPASRVLISLTYEKYDSGIVTTENDGYIYSNGSWEKSMGISSDEYKAMGEVRAQFSNEDEALVKIPLFLKNKLQYEAPEKGRIEGVMYKLYVTDTQDIDKDGSIKDKAVYSYVVFYIYDGTNWIKYNNTINETIQFGHDGSNWVPDNTIKYTLTRGANSDYDWIASQLTSAEYASLIGNLSNYDDFDYNWSDAQILHAMTLFADHHDPTAAEDQKYLFTYVVYDNGENEHTINLIKTGGVWVKNQ